MGHSAQRDDRTPWLLGNSLSVRAAKTPAKEFSSQWLRSAWEGLRAKPVFSPLALGLALGLAMLGSSLGAQAGTPAAAAPPATAVPPPPPPAAAASKAVGTSTPAADVALDDGANATPEGGDGGDAAAANTAPAASEADQQSALLSELVGLLASAPDSYEIHRNDSFGTLARKYVENGNPHAWALLWRLSNDEATAGIPLLPGDILMLDRKEQPPRIRLFTTEANQAERTNQLLRQQQHEQLMRKSGPVAKTGQPCLQVSGVGSDGRKQVKQIPCARTVSVRQANDALVIRRSVIEPLLNQTTFVPKEMFDTAARVVQAEDDRVLVSQGDWIDAIQLEGGKNGDRWQIVHAGATFSQQDNPKIQDGYAVTLVGEAKQGETVLHNKEGVITRLQITRVFQEIQVGDRLLQKPENIYLDYIPRLPIRPIDAQIISSYGTESRSAGPYTTVVLDQGSAAGLEFGHVLNVYQVLNYDKLQSFWRGGLFSSVKTSAPQKIGTLFVYRVLPRFAYALVLESNRAIAPGDIVH